MAIKTISLKDLQSLQASKKIILKKIGNCNYLQQKTDSVNISQENGSNKQIQKNSIVTTVLQNQLVSQDSKLIWTKQATFALLSAYEARNIETDITKKNKKFWQSVADELNELSLFNVPLTEDQVRWKFSALKKSYYKKKDHNRTSGNALKIFDDFEERLMDILGDKNSDYNKENCFNSPILEHSVSNQPEVQNARTADCDLQNVNIEQEINNNKKNVERKVVQKKSVHGTGSKIARTKVDLENQWLQHLQFIHQKYEDRKNVDEIESKRKIEELELKREKLHLKKKKLFLEEQKLKQKIEQHREKVSIEKEKCDLLRSLIQSRNSIF